MSKRAASKHLNLERAAEPYQAFNEIDGRHPWQTSVPDGFVPYEVRKLEKGEVAYFNFALAREMGLISSQHPDSLTPALTEKILETFCIQIINEYDMLKGVRTPKEKIKEHPHMATRYLQLQHADKKGRTSGDGRSIWNGIVSHKGKIWDVSSRGTGVTCLAPGAVEANKPLKTGVGTFGYGCGLADLSELLGSAVLSEIFHLNDVPTERVLTVIDLGRGCGIGVRAAPNLIRPAHLFLYLKQGRLEECRQATDYLIKRQSINGQWKISSNATDRYQRMLEEIATSFAQFAARLERNYIFAWLDWDGDNVLADAGIIDYGSIRQFGLRHDQYRYDDVDRFSTNLNEQRGKARLTVQVFAQLAKFLETGKREPLEAFAKHASLKQFDREFDLELRRVFLAQVGFDTRQSAQLRTNSRKIVEDLYSTFLALEKTKTKAGQKQLPDGVNRPAVFNMRALLRELPSMILRSGKDLSSAKVLQAEEILESMTSSFAKRADTRLKGMLRSKIEKFQRAYLNALKAACGDSGHKVFLKNLGARAEDENRAGRVTGNGAEFVVDELIRAHRKGVSHQDIQVAIDLFIASQSPKSALQGRNFKPASLQSPAGRLFQELVNLSFEFQEDV